MNTNNSTQQTLVLIKPDALKNSLTGYVLSYLSEFHTGLIFAGAKIVHVSKMLAEEHYAEHKGKPFYASLIEYIMGKYHYPDQPEKRRVIAIVYRGEDAIAKIRNIAGPTNPLDARIKKPGCIRSLGSTIPIKDEKGTIIDERMDNLIHASANPSDAEREIKLWFKPHDIPPPMHPYETEVCEEHYYYFNGQLTKEYRRGAICLLAPGNVAWKSDLDALNNIIKGRESSIPLNSVIAKYLINEKEER